LRRFAVFTLRGRRREFAGAGLQAVYESMSKRTMISRQEKIHSLARQNRRRRNLEIIVPQLRQIFGHDFSESKLSIAEPEDFHENLKQTVSVHYVWAFEDLSGIESFCAAFAGEVGDASVKVFVPQLETGVLEIGLQVALTNAVAFLQAFDSFWLYEPQSLAEFGISKHAYYYYGDNVKTPKEYKWELTVRGFWAEAARRYLEDD
jgi:hypothetical protein